MSTPIAVHTAGGGPAGGGKGPAPAGGLLAKVKKNPTMLLAGGGAVVVVLFALMRRSSASTDAGQSADTLQMTGAGSTYDSTSNDLYNSIQPEIDALAQMIQQMQNGLGTPAPPTTGTTTPPKLGNGPGTTPPKTPVITPVKKPTPVKAAPKPTTKTVVVKSGDTLSGIAAKYGISMTTLKKLNPVYWSTAKYKNGNMIWSGDKVRVK